MSEGWIKLHRRLLENPMWNKEPFTMGQAWVDLLLMASHKDSKFLLNGSWFVVKRGQLHTSILQLSNRWRWSRGKVTRFLNVLEADNMITQKRSSGGTSNGTTLTIVKYGDFQCGDTADSTTDDTTNGQRSIQRSVQRSDIYKNDKECKKNEKNEKEIINRAFSPPTFEDVTAYCEERNNSIDPQTFIDFYSSKGWYIGKNKMKDWKAAIRTWEKHERKEVKSSAYMDSIKNRVNIVDSWLD